MAPPAFDLLHPSLVELLPELGIRTPTEPQAAAIPRILDGANCLLIAPTGSGKTEAALLPILSKMLSTPQSAIRNPQSGIECLYITPLRALNRDMLRRVEALGRKLSISVAVRHGDTPQRERNLMAREPPRILLTTPETFQILFLGRHLRRHIMSARWVVVDELHELAGDERGAQMAVALERLAALRGEFQRIGLSATIGNAEEVAGFLGGVGRRVEVLNCGSLKDISVEVVRPEVKEEDRAAAEAVEVEPGLAACLRTMAGGISGHRSTLLFVNTRDSAEVLTSRLHALYPDLPASIHHGSLSKEARIASEEEFKAGTLRGLVCTSSLELGIDIGRTDFILLFNSPRQVCRLVQRVGRTGHRPGERSHGAVVALTDEEMLEAAVIARRAAKAQVEPVGIRLLPWSVLANQVVAMALTGECTGTGGMYRIVKRSMVFHTLTEKRMEEFVQYLRDLRLLSPFPDTVRARQSGRGYFYGNISMIPDERTYTVVNAADRRPVGRLDEAFVASCASATGVADRRNRSSGESPGLRFIMRGRAWEVVDVENADGEEGLMVLVTPADGFGAVPSWTGEDLPVPFEVAQEVGAARGALLGDGPLPDLPVAGAQLERLRAVFREWASRGFASGTAGCVVVEHEAAEGGRSTAVVVHVCGGTKANEALGWLLASQLGARLGVPVTSRSDAYRVLLRVPGRTGPDMVADLLRTTSGEGVEYLLHLALRGTPVMQYALLAAARKFGAVAKGADVRGLGKRIEEMYRGTPLHDEAVARLLWDRMDAGAAAVLLHRIESGEVRLAISKAPRLSPSGRAFVEEEGALLLSRGSDSAILTALQGRLEGEEMRAACLRCWRPRRFRPADGAPPPCPRCGSVLIACASPGDPSMRRSSPPRGNAMKRMLKSAELLLHHGKRAAIALSARGIGPDTAARLLAGYYENDAQFLKAILAAEVQYARTRRFWE